jgi:hypothetical protein
LISSGFPIFNGNIAALKHWNFVSKYWTNFKLKYSATSQQAKLAETRVVYEALLHDGYWQKWQLTFTKCLRTEKLSLS